MRQRNLFDRPPTRSGGNKSETSEKEEPAVQQKPKPGLARIFCFSLISLIKYFDIQSKANSADPDQTAPDQSLHCLLFISGNRMISDRNYFSIYVD